MEGEGRAGEGRKGRGGKGRRSGLPPHTDNFWLRHCAEYGKLDY